MKAYALCVFICCAALCSFNPAGAHCDTLDGPVVKDAKLSLEKSDVTPVLKWVQKSDEAAISGAFQKTLAVRSKGKDSQELADRYFLETLVRLHRAGEGAPFAGLQPADAEINPAVAVAEKALAAGNPEALKNFLTFTLDEGLQEKFKQAEAKKNFRADDVAAGRKYVAAYVALMHYVEGIYEAAHSAGYARYHEGAAAHRRKTDALN